MKTDLEEFLYSDVFSHRMGRICLPVLISRAEQYKATVGRDIPEFTYGDLGKIVAKHPRPLHWALGSIGHALKDLEKRPEWTLGKIPPIQLLVWTAGQGSPGDDGFGFLGIKKEEVMAMSPATRMAVAARVRSDILSYAHWREVLSALKLQPTTLDLPSINEVSKSVDNEWKGGGESAHHKRLKHYVAQHYEKLGFEGHFEARVEVCLPSGDRIDVMLEDKTNRLLVCIEVKSRISNSDDLIRGVFQCIKYRALLDAAELYELRRVPSHRERTIRVLLVTELSLPSQILGMVDFLGIEARKTSVPSDYRIPN